MLASKSSVLATRSRGDLDAVASSETQTPSKNRFIETCNSPRSFQAIAPRWRTIEIGSNMKVLPLAFIGRGMAVFGRGQNLAIFIEPTEGQTGTRVGLVEKRPRVTKITAANWDTTISECWTQGFVDLCPRVSFFAFTCCRLILSRRRGE